MFHFSFSGAASLYDRPIRSAAILPTISLPFLLGTLSGCIVGSFSVNAGEGILSSGLFSVVSIPSTFLAALWISFRFILAAAFFATGIFGVFLIPALSALRGFSFACTVAFTLQIRSMTCILRAFFSFGIPAMLCLPAFLLAGTDAFLCSKSLLRRITAIDLHEIPFISHSVLILSLCTVNALYISILLPKLLHLVS